MTNKFELTLDLSKKNSNLNSPVIIRQGDSKEGTTIEATILDHGMTYSALSEASFYCTKPDNTVVLGDPATVNGNIITYNVNTQVGACSGNIERAFFSLNNGLVSTGNFEIIVLPGTDISGESSDYLPALQQLQNEWQEKLDDIKSQVQHMDLSGQLKDVVNQAVDEAVQAANKKLQTVEDELKQAILNANNSISEVTDLISTLEKKKTEIDDWISQEHSIVLDNLKQWELDFEKSLNDTVEKQSTLTTNVAELQTQLNGISEQITEIDVPSLNEQVSTANTNANKAIEVANGKTDISYVNTVMNSLLNNQDVDIGDSKVKRIDTTITDLNVARKSDIPDHSQFQQKSQTKNIKVLSQSEYDAITTPDTDTLYFIPES